MIANSTSKADVPMVTFESLNNYVRKALSPEDLKNYDDFFHSIYKVSFVIENIGKFDVTTNAIGSDFSSHIIEVLPFSNALIELKPKGCYIGFGFYLAGEAEGLLPETGSVLKMKKNRSIACVSNYDTSHLKIQKGNRFINLTIFSPFESFLSFAGNRIKELPEIFVNAILNQKELFLVEGPSTPYIQNLVQQLYSIQTSGPSKLFFQEHIALQILGHQTEALLMQNYQEYRVFAEETLMDTVKALIESNLETPLTIPELAKEIGINTQKLKRSFKKHFKTTIYQYIVSKRMEVAKNLLLHEGYSVKETAYTVGYKNPNAFSNMFLKQLGVRPVELTKPLKGEIIRL